MFAVNDNSSRLCPDKPIRMISNVKSIGSSNQSGELVTQMKLLIITIAIILYSLKLAINQELLNFMQIVDLESMNPAGIALQSVYEEFL